MQIAFTKMNGAGNDFVLIDNRGGSIRLNSDQVRLLCDRQRGVGADGLLLLEPNSNGVANWRWRFFNSDGGSAEMCGNGARCFAAFVRNLTRPTAGISFETPAGIVRATFVNDLVTITLPAPKGLRLHQPLLVNGAKFIAHSLHTGVPHAVVFVDDADKAMTEKRGQAIRAHPHFAPAGTNVNFAEILRPDCLRIRTYERGVEGETLACGTGAAAAAMIASHIRRVPTPISVKVQGGDFLTVDFKTTESGFKAVQLTGPAETVFTGEIEI